MIGTGPGFRAPHAISRIILKAVMFRVFRGQFSCDSLDYQGLPETRTPCYPQSTLRKAPATNFLRSGASMEPSLTCLPSLVSMRMPVLRRRRPRRSLH